MSYPSNVTAIVTKEMWIEEKRKMKEKEMTPCEKMGIAEGDDVVVIVDEYIQCEGIKAGDTITLIEDDGSDLPYFSGSNGHKFYVELAHVRKINPTPEDSINISVTYGELARAYAYMGITNGGDSSLWSSLRDILDPEGKIYHLFANQIRNSAKLGTLNYACIKEDWLAALFPQKEEKVTVEQKKILELEETIKKAQQQIDAIKENMQWDELSM